MPWNFVTIRQSRFFLSRAYKKGSKLAKITVNIFDLTRNTKIHQVEIRKGVEKNSHNIFQSKNRHFHFKNEPFFQD